MASETTSQIYTTFSATDATSPYGHFPSNDDSELLLTENYMDYGDAFNLPYPTPPDESGFNSIPTTISIRSNILLVMENHAGNLKPSSDRASTISDTTDNEDIVVAISTSFNPNSHSVQPDLIFSTLDMVFFYAHSQVLKSISSEAFDRVLWRSEKTPTGQVMAGAEIIHHAPDPSAVFNIVLHALYGSFPAQNSPGLDTLITAVDRMPFYGINPKDVIAKQTPLYQLLLTQAPLFPLHLYSLAGRHRLEDLAVSTSSHLLSFPISQLSDDLALQMGSVYLKRLFCLHFNRINVLKEILLVPPFPHPPTKECDFTEQKALTRAWALVAAHLAWDARPGEAWYRKENSLHGNFLPPHYSESHF